MADKQLRWTEDLAAHVSLNTLLVLPRGDNKAGFRKAFEWMQWQLKSDSRVAKAGHAGSKGY
eukprot:12890870-Prorocentrum_lima.AAC.1